MLCHVKMTCEQEERQRSVQPIAALPPSFLSKYHYHRDGDDNADADADDDDGDDDDDDDDADDDNDDDADTNGCGCRENVDAPRSVEPSSGPCARGFFAVTTNVEWDRAKNAALAQA